MVTASPRFYGTGRRKTANARVWISPGTGQFSINGQPADEYFHRESTQLRMVEPLLVLQKLSDIDISAKVRGGGQTGQADAVRHGLSRALVVMDPECRAQLKPAGLMTRDARIKERKKYGQPGARKRFQYSKR